MNDVFINAITETQCTVEEIDLEDGKNIYYLKGYREPNHGNPGLRLFNTQVEIEDLRDIRKWLPVIVNGKRVLEESILD